MQMALVRHGGTPRHRREVAVVGRRPLMTRLSLFGFGSAGICGVLVALTLASPIVVLAAQATDEAAVPRMTLAVFKKALDAGTVLAVDVRDPASFAKAHIPGAILVTLGDYGSHLAELKAAGRTIVTYCG
jgi:hypothetical protein